MKIKIDTKEPPWILSRISKHPFFVSSEIELAALDYGDIWIDDIVIERKTIPDLLGSIADNRLSNQAAKMRECCEYSYLLIEGFLGWYDEKIFGTNWHFRSVQGALLQVQELGVCIVHAADEYDLPATLAWLAKRDRSKILTVSPRKYGVPMTDGEKMLSALPGIGLERADKLLKEFGNVAAVLECLTDVDCTLPAGIGDKIRDKIRWTLLLEDEILKVGRNGSM
jgi:DNA excision repair protein ERCC-4/Fanconi anemia group M protein